MDISPNGNELHLTCYSLILSHFIGQGRIKKVHLESESKVGCAFFPEGIRICHCLASSVVNLPFSAYPAKAQKHLT